MFIRRNDSVKNFWKNNSFFFRFGVTIPFLQTNTIGFPTEDENATFLKIEDTFIQEFEKDQKSILVLIITLVGAREFVFYTKYPNDIESILDSIKKQFLTHEFQFYIEEDKNWVVYKQFLK